MSTQEDHFDPNNPMSYAPRWIREEARSRSIASNETRPELPERSATSPSSFDTFSEAVSKSLRNRLDPEVMDEPPGYDNRFGQWRELIPVAMRFAAAVGVSALVALFFVSVIPASKDRVQDHVQDSTASLVPASSKTASQTQAPRASESRSAESRPAESKPSLAQFETILAADRAAQPAENAGTHEQSEALFNQFVRWQQKLDSTDAPPQ
jgi:hypothetical protein